MPEPERRRTDSAGWTRIAELEAERDRLQVECAVLAEALDAVTHDFRSAGGVMCADGLGLWPVPCALAAEHRVHRTSARVRAEHGHGAT